MRWLCQLKTRKLLWAQRHRERPNGRTKRATSADRFRLHPCCPGLHVLSVFLAATSTITLHHSSFISHPLSYGVPLYNKNHVLVANVSGGCGVRGDDDTNRGQEGHGCGVVVRINNIFPGEVGGWWSLNPRRTAWGFRSLLGGGRQSRSGLWSRSLPPCARVRGAGRCHRGRRVPRGRRQ